MSIRKELPPDFHAHWFQNAAFELLRYTSLTPLFDKEGRFIRMYEYKVRRGKHIQTHKIRFNTMTSLYEINTTRYATYPQVLETMWKIESNPPL